MAVVAIQIGVFYVKYKRTDASSQPLPLTIGLAFSNQIVTKVDILFCCESLESF